MEFEAFRVEKTDTGTEHSIVTRSVDDLPDGCTHPGSIPLSIIRTHCLHAVCRE